MLMQIFKMDIKKFSDLSTRTKRVLQSSGITSVESLFGKIGKWLSTDHLAFELYGLKLGNMSALEVCSLISNNCDTYNKDQLTQVKTRTVSELERNAKTARKMLKKAKGAII